MVFFHINNLFCLQTYGKYSKYFINNKKTICQNDFYNIP